MFHTPRVLNIDIFMKQWLLLWDFWIPPIGPDLVLQCFFGSGAVSLDWLLTSTLVGCSLNRVREPRCAEFIPSVRTQIPFAFATSLTAF